MTDSIRALNVGVEAVPNVLALARKRIPYISFKPVAKLSRIPVKVHNGTRTRLQKNLVGIAHEEASLKTPSYYDHNGHFFAAAFGAPNSVAHATAIGVTQHTFKVGSGVPTLSMQSNKGVPTWMQTLGVSVDQLDITISPDKITENDYKLIGHVESDIAAPTAIPDSTAPYLGNPMNGLVAVVLGGGSTADVLSGKISIKFNRAQMHTLRTTADMVRATEGEVVGTFDLMVRYVAHGGSLYEGYLGNGVIPGALAVLWTDTQTQIGTTSPTNPQQYITIPSPTIDSVDLDPEKPETVQQLKGSFAYDPQTGTSVTMVLVNEIALYSGS